MNWIKKLFSKKKALPGTVQRMTRVVDFGRPRKHPDDIEYDGGINAPVELDLEKANVVTSEAADGGWDIDANRPMHYPVIDIDLPVTVVPSSTPGHSHLYIDTPMAFRDYSELLHILSEFGLVEQGYADAVAAQGYGILRLPWVEKGAK